MLTLMTDPKLGIPNEPDNKGMLPIHLAVLTDNYDAVAHLLKFQSVNGESDVNRGQAEDFTPVHYACHRGNLEILQLLLDSGGNLNVVSKKGVTCLHLACGSGKLEMARFLIEVQQFSPEVVTIISGSKPIHMAAKSGDIEIMKYLISKRNCNPVDIDNNQEDCLTLAIKEK